MEGGAVGVLFVMTFFRLPGFFLSHVARLGELLLILKTLMPSALLRTDCVFLWKIFYEAIGFSGVIT